MTRTALLYDEDCGLCRSVTGAILALDRRERLRPVAIGSEEARALTSQMSDEQREGTFHIVDPDGTVHSGGDGLAELIPPLRRTPRLAEVGYHAVAGRRSALGKLIPGALKRRADRRIAARS